MLSVPQIVVESPTSYEAPVGSKDVCPAADRVVPLLPQESQVSQLSSVQLSPIRVRADYDFDSMYVLLMYAGSPRNDGYFPSVSPISPPNALSKPGSLFTPATGSLDERSNRFAWQHHLEPGDVIINHQLYCGFDPVVGTVDSASGSYVASACTGPGAASHIPWLSALTRTGSLGRPIASGLVTRRAIWCFHQTGWHQWSSVDFIRIDRVLLPDDDIPVKRMLLIWIWRSGCSCITRDFWSASARRSRPGCWVVP